MRLATRCASVSGEETEVKAYGRCEGGTRVVTWSIKGAGRTPALSTTATHDMLATLFG